LNFPAAVRNKKAFSFIQILIAIVLLSITVVPVASLFMASSKNVEKGGAILDATIILQSIVDSIKNDRFIFDNKGKTIDFPDDKYPALVIEKGFLEKYKARGQVIIEQAEGHDDKNLISIMVTLKWLEDGSDRQTSLVTYVANLNDMKYDKIE